MNPYTSHPLFDIIGTALLHFVWQGLLIAFLLAVFLACTKKSAPNLRYVMSWIALVAMLFLPAYSILTEFQSLSAFEPRGVQGSGFKVQGSGFKVQGLGEEVGGVVGGEVEGAVGIGESHVGEGYVEEEAFGFFAWIRPYLALVWGIGVLGMMVRLMVGCWWVHRLKVWRSVPVEGELQAVFDRLVGRAGIRRDVMLRKTSDLAEAVLIGWVKPAVLLPMSVVSEMSMGHIEAIIAHELAHVKRLDPFFAGIQALIETVLFYHPAVWWVSRQIRIEREHCCDDLAVRILNDKPRYARALFELEHQRAGFGRFALSVQDGSLLARIKRLAAAPEKRSTSRQVRPVLSSMVVIGVISISLLLGSCADFRVESENPVSIGERYELPPRLESMVVGGDRDGIITFLHDAHNSGDEETLKMIAGVYDRANEGIRRSLMFVLAHINSPEADQVLIQMAEADPSEEVRYGAMRSITVRMDEIMEYDRFNVQEERTITASQEGYKYPSLTADQELALASGLERIALDNTQFTDVREEALIALAHKEGSSSFMREVIRTTQDEFVAIKAAGYLESIDEAAAEIIQIFYAASTESVKSGAMSKLGDVKAMSAVPVLMVQSFEGSTEDIRYQTSKRGIRYGMPAFWTAQNSLVRLYRQAPGGESILGQVEAELASRLTRLEQEVDQGIPSRVAREEALEDLQRLISMTFKFRNWVDMSNPLAEYNERAEALKARIEQL